MTIIERALEFVTGGSRIGLGSGRAARAFVKALPYRAEGRLFVSDNGNHILDCETSPIHDATRLEADVRAIPGVVGTGLFLGMAETVLVGAQRDFRLIDDLRCGPHPVHLNAMDQSEYERPVLN